VAAVRSAGLRVSSLCRGGFFTAGDADRREAVRADNVAAVQEAAALGADALVLVCGGLVPGSRDLGLARRMVAYAIGELVPFAQRLGIRLGIEALHPMFCADRCVIASLGEAVDLALLFPAEAVGVVVDTYHVWWDARLALELERAAGRILSYQVCDWVVPLPADVLLGRGHLGDGVIDFGPISDAVAAAGYQGYVEVEIFNADVWAAPPDETAATVRERFAVVLGGAVPRGLPGRSVTSQDFGAVGAAGTGGAVGVEGDGPAPLVDGDVMVEETVERAPVHAGLATVGQVSHMVDLAGRGRLVAAAGPPAMLVPQDHRAADRGGDLGAVPDVQRQAGPGQAGAELPGAQEAGQPAGTGDQVDGLADDGVAEHLQGLRRGRPRAGPVLGRARLAS
jgi:sugar phosphate isomerase/epimerase